MSSTAEGLPLIPANDLAAYRSSLGAFPTGITVMTAAHNGENVGVTANSFGSVSLDPPLVLWNLRKSSPSLPIFHAAGHWAVNVLAWHQEELSRRFATPAEDKFAGLRIGEGLGGAPLLEGCATRYECRLVHEFTTGDHAVLIGEVHRYHNFHREPLIFFRGSHRWFDQPVVS
jgi:flavin reductase (DIM6/NTAB) family NADH-FMN oxidoreductase RutF